MSDKEVKNIPKLRFPEFKNAPEWENKKLGKIATFFKGKNISKADINEQGITPCIRYGELYTQYKEVINEIVSKTNIPPSNLFFSCENDVIIPSSGETKLDIATASCVTREGIALGADINIIRSKHNGIFMSYYLNSSKKMDIAKIAQGDTVVHLYLSQLQQLDILLPTNLHEQQKIADCLSSIDELITAQSTKIEALKKHKKALMQQLFPHEGKTVPRLRFPEFHNTPEWAGNKLGKISQIVRGGSPRPIEEYITNSNQGLNWLKIGDVQQEAKYITHTTEKVIYSALNKTREVFPNDLILSNSMSFGRPYIMKIKSCIHDGWISITKILKITNTDYLYYFISSSSSQSYFVNNSAGAVVQNLNAKIIKNLPILLPSVQEQQKIADCLSSIDELITTHIAKTAALKKHKKALMQQLFPATNEVN